MDKNREELIEEVRDASIAIEDFWDLSIDDQDKAKKTRLQDTCEKWERKRS